MTVLPMSDDMELMTAPGVVERQSWPFVHGHVPLPSWMQRVIAGERLTRQERAEAKRYRKRMDRAWWRMSGGRGA